jgi:hypothetical protein
LTCAIEGLSAKRFDEYRRWDRVPRSTVDRPQSTVIRRQSIVHLSHLTTVFATGRARGVEAKWPSGVDPANDDLGPAEPDSTTRRWYRNVAVAVEVGRADRGVGGGWRPHVLTARRVGGGD